MCDILCVELQRQQFLLSFYHEELYNWHTVPRDAEKRILFDVMGFNSEAQTRTKAQGTWPLSGHNTLSKLHSAGGRDNHKQKKNFQCTHWTNKPPTLGYYVEASKTAYTEQRILNFRKWSPAQLRAMQHRRDCCLKIKINALRNSQEFLPWLCSGKETILAECLNKVVAMEKKTCFALLCALECN